MGAAHTTPPPPNPPTPQAFLPAPQNTHILTQTQTLTHPNTHTRAPASAASVGGGPTNAAVGGARRLRLRRPGGPARPSVGAPSTPVASATKVGVSLVYSPAAHGVPGFLKFQTSNVLSSAAT